jgi:hypothetical protein
VPEPKAKGKAQRSSLISTETWIERVCKDAMLIRRTRPTNSMAECQSSKLVMGVRFSRGALWCNRVVFLSVCRPGTPERQAGLTLAAAGSHPSCLAPMRCEHVRICTGLLIQGTGFKSLAAHEGDYVLASR